VGKVIFLFLRLGIDINIEVLLFDETSTSVLNKIKQIHNMYMKYKTILEIITEFLNEMMSILWEFPFRWTLK